MNYNNILNKQISQLGIGFASHKNNSQEMVDLAFKNGINYFEACTFYLNNQCETIVGKCLSNYNRNDYILCDKICLNGLNINELNMENFFNEQLKKCQVEYFDVYLIQAVNKNTLKILKENPFILKFLNNMKKEKKILNLGFSFHDNLDTLKEMFLIQNWDIIQIQINFFDWYKGQAKELYQFLVEKNIPIIAMEPCKGGQIIKMTSKNFQNKLNQYYPNINFYQICLTFLQHLPNIKIILTGAKNITELEQNITWINNKLKFTNKDKEICKLLIQDYCESNLIPCTNCKYCESVCSKNLKISDMFLFTNNILLEKNKKEYQDKLISITKNSNYGFYSCIHCKKCENICPQHLKITDYFKTVQKMEM